MLSVLYGVLLIVAAIGSSLMMLDASGVELLLLVMVVVLLPVFLWIFKSTYEAIGGYVLILIAMALLYPYGNGSSEQWIRRRCRSGISRFALAVKNYAEQHSRLPPPSINDADGTPINSWRVLVKPYMGDDGKSFYEEYDLNEPWDGPKNSKLIAEYAPYSWVCWSDLKELERDSLLTSYVAVVGESTTWAEQKPRKPGEGRSILIVEVKAEIPWVKPVDYDLSMVKSRRLEIAANHLYSAGFFFQAMPAARVAFSDYEVQLAPVEILANDEVFQQGMNFDDETLDRWVAEHRRVHWIHVIALAVFVVSWVLSCHWAVRYRKKRIAEKYNVPTPG